MAKPLLTIPGLDGLKAREAKDLARRATEEPSDDLIAWTTRLIEARDDWTNRKTRT